MSIDPNCIFCKIVGGDIPCHEIFHDEHVLAFLDIGPLTPGHVLVVPKQHYQTMNALPAEQASALGAVLPRLTQAVLDVTGAEGVNVLQNNGEVAGQEVPHVHVHLIPRMAGDGLGYRWHPQSYGEGEAEAVRDKLRQAIG